MDFGVIAKRAEKLISNNSPALLTAIGVTGTVVTAVLTGKATVKALEIIAEEEKNFVEEEMEEGDGVRLLNLKEKVFLVWKCYIPPFISGTLTIAAIISANRIGTRRAAALASAYSLSEKAFEEYRAKVKEKLGEKKEEAARAEVAQDRLNENPLSKSKIVIVDNGSDYLCYDARSRRYLNSSQQILENAAIDINREILIEGSASLSEFYNLIGLEPTGESDEVGWNLDQKFELEYFGDLSAEGKPCLVFNFKVQPIHRFHKIF